MNLLETDDNMFGDYEGFQFEQNKADELVTRFKEGHIKGSRAYVELRALKDGLVEIFDNAIKEVESGVVDELTQLNDKEELIVLGNKLSHVKGRSNYQYKQCPMYADADKEVRRIRELIKTATNNGVEIMDKETGEIIEPVEVKQGKGYLKLEKAK